MTKEERNKMVNKLIEHEIDVNFGDRSYLEDVLRTGLEGYDSLSDKEIQIEFDGAGLEL